jgi:hypothetical protein
MLAAWTARADDAWETVQTDPIVVKTRTRKGTSIKEVWAEGDVDAAPVDLQAALTDVSRFTQFMPYLTEARTLGKPDPDGAVYTYSKLDLPVLSARDFIHKSYVDRDVRTDPAGAFANHWFSVPDKIPHRHYVVRLELSEGSWVVTPLPNGRSHVVYHFAVDPAGMVPSFAANKSNSGSVVQTFKNVEHEAQRRAAERASPRTP